MGGLAPEVIGIIRQFSGEVEAPTNFIFSNMLASISSLVAKRVRVLDGSYENRLNLFWANVGDVGSGKSPARNIVKKPISAEEKKMYDEYRKKKAWYNGLTPEQKRDEEEPVRVRIVLDNSDTSMEAFLVVLDENSKMGISNGVFLNLDELTDFFPNLNRYSGKNGNPLAKFLHLYNCEDISVERLMREDQYIKEPICTIIGGIQPDRLRMVYGGEYGSGFVPRWLFFLENKPQKGVEPNQVYQCFWDEIVELAFDLDPIDLRFSAEAEKELHENHDKRKRQNLLLRQRSKYLGEYIVKQNYTVRRIAGIVHVINALAARKHVKPEITVDEYRYAESLVDYLIKSAMVFMSLMSGKMPLKQEELTLEEAYVQLFRNIPDINVTAFAKAIGKDKSNILRAKRKYISSLPKEKKASFIFWADLSEEYPRLGKIAGGFPDEETLMALLSTCRDDTDKFFEVLSKMESSPILAHYNKENIWVQGWADFMATF